MAKFTKGNTFISVLEEYESYGEALAGTYEKYGKSKNIRAGDIRYVARAANEGIQYAISQSKHNTITGYQIYRDVISKIKNEFKLHNINFGDIFIFDNKGFTIRTSKQLKSGKYESIYEQYNQEQRRVILAAFEYIRRSPFTSESRKKIHELKIGEKGEQAFKKKYKLSDAEMQNIAKIFPFPEWQALRKSMHYEEFEQDTKIEIMKETVALNDDEMRYVLKKGADANDFAEFSKIVAEYYEGR